MNLLKASILALALAGMGTQAHAASYSSSTPIVVGSSYTFMDGLVAQGSSGFSDEYTFTLDSGATGVNFLFNLSAPGSQFSSISFGWSGSGEFTGWTGGYSGPQSYTVEDADGDSLTLLSLDSVTYRFGLKDISSGTRTISLSAHFDTPFVADKNYSLTVSAVPEPESYAMFLAGLGLMAGVARRKAKTGLKG